MRSLLTIYDHLGHANFGDNFGPTRKEIDRQSEDLPRKKSLNHREPG